MTERRPEAGLWETTDARRIELGKRWKDVTAETGLSHETLNRWRKGFKVDPFTDRAFEKALGWNSGARDAIAAGRPPEPLAEAPPEPDAPTAAVAVDSWRLEAMREILKGVPLRDRPAVLSRLEELLEEEAQRPQDSNAERPERNAM